MDYRQGAAGRAAWLGATALLSLTLEDQSRVLVRPSGTEPKLKIYADAHVTERQGESISAASARASGLARLLADELAAWLKAAP